jgi:regulatory protein
MIITAVERQPRRRRRVNVFVDGELALTVSPDLAMERRLRPGRTLSPGELASIADAEARRSAREAALRLLAYRPRSERELRDRLRRRGLPRPVVDDTVVRMRELGYLDDAAFARFWAETQQSARPRSRRLLASELRGRGIAQEAANEATAGISDEEAAYSAASRRARVFRELEYGPFRERLGRFLTQRGFTYEVSRRTIERCWAERAGPESGEA